MSRDRLEELKEEKARLDEQAEIKALETYNQSRRTVQEAWGDLVDRNEYMKDTPDFFLGNNNFISFPHNRRDGDFRPHFCNEHDLQRIRGKAQWLSAHHPVGVGLLDDLTNYTISTGYSYKLAHKELSVMDEQVMAVAQEVIDEFVERTNNHYPECSFEREIFKRSREAGEAFIHVEEVQSSHTGEPGYAEINVIEPEWITQPKVQGLDSPIEGPVDWRYGVATEIQLSKAGKHGKAVRRHRSERVKGFFVTWNGEAEVWDTLLPEEIVHLKLNTPRVVKRGLSDFYGVDTYLEDQEKLFRNTARGAAIQAAIALIREHQPGMRGADVERLSGKYDSSFNLPSYPGGNRSRTIKVRESGPGTILDVVGSRYHPGPLGAPNGPTYMEIAAALGRVVGTRWSMPEHMIGNAISGGGGARAALIEQGTPFARATQNRQIMYSKYFQRVIWRVLQIAAAAGRLPVPFQILRQNFELKVDIPEATQRNEAEQHMVLAGRNQAGLLSKRSWSETVNIDRDKERERLAEDVEEMPMLDPMGASMNQQPEANQQQAQGAPGQGHVPGQRSTGTGADSRYQDRSGGTRNPAQSLRQKNAATRAGKDT